MQITIIINPQTQLLTRVLFLVILFQSIQIFASDTRTRIESLPGQQVTPVPFAQYTGYIVVRGGNVQRKLFYWLAESQGNPSIDPIVIWFTGGPGCSGLFALFTEHGPWRIKGKEQLLDLNPYSWNREATIVYVESPCGVGFSQSLDQNYTTGDDDVAKDSYVFVHHLFDLFPEYQKNPLFIMGESYGGNYVPQLVYRLLFDHSLLRNFNLQGMGVGNPTTDHQMDSNNYFSFMAMHGLSSTQMWDLLQQSCKGDFVHRSPDCQAAINQMRSGFGNLNPYNIYAACHGPPSENGACFTELFMSKKNNTNGQTVVPCIDTDAVTKYLNRLDVQKALNIVPLHGKLPLDWSVCSQILNYNQYLPTQIPFYKKIVPTGIQVLLYSGDVDSCVPYIGTERSVDAMNFTLTTPWHPWKVADSFGPQVAGYIKAFNGGNLMFATVKNAGHMCPTDKPEQTFVLFTNFIHKRLIP
jgi:carboxypeptidase C (cathepsin A)